MINISRSNGIINPEDYRGSIHVIGVGATGSRVVKSLVELGFRGNQIHIHDFDEVEGHNVNNQEFNLQHVGMKKVDAMARIIKEGYDEDLNVSDKAVDGSTPLEGIVFLLTDTMSSRSEIFNSMKYNTRIKLVIETRLDPRAGYIHTLNPCNLEHNNFFEKELFDDDDEGVEVSACGTPQTIGHTVDILSGMAMTEFVKFVNDNKQIGKQIFFATEPYFLQEKKIVG